MKNDIEDNSGFTSRWVSVNDLSIHYKCAGHGQPLLLIHGGGNDWHEWKMNLAFFAHSFQVLAIDLPGFGLSQLPATPISFSWSTEFLKAFMDQLDINAAHLVGHSLGGMMSIAFAASYPQSVDRLVLVDTCGLGEISSKGRLLLSIFRILDHWQGKKRGPEYLFESATDDWRVLSKLPDIKSPALIIWGENDIYLPVSQSRTAHTLIPKSRLNIFSHCGHAPQREKPEEFNDLVLQFLSSE